MYDTLRRDFYRLMTTYDDYHLEMNRNEYHKTETRRGHQKLRNIPATDSFQSTSIDIFGQFQCTIRRNEFVTVILDRFRRLIKQYPGPGHLNAHGAAFLLALRSLPREYPPICFVTTSA